MVSECTVNRLRDLASDFREGTCGTFIIDSSPSILLCFGWSEKRKCRLWTRRKDGSGTIIEIETLRDSTHNHYLTTLANNQGFPLILGGPNNNKLEMLNTMENPPRWIEYEETDYPYSNT